MFVVEAQAVHWWVAHYGNTSTTHSVSHNQSLGVRINYPFEWWWNFKKLLLKAHIMDRWNKAQHSLRAEAHMCFYICSGYFNLMLNKRRPRLKDNNVSSSAQAAPPERVRAHQQTGGRADGRVAQFLEKKLANTQPRQSWTSRECISCLSPAKSADAPVDLETEYIGVIQKGRGLYGDLFERNIYELFFLCIVFNEHV